MSITRHKRGWRVELMHNHVRHRKAGFTTLQKAQEAELVMKQQLKTTNSDFTKLSESRLLELQAKRGKQHFTENKALILKLTELWGLKSEITRNDVEAFLNQTACTVSNNRANQYLRLIHALFQHGVEHQLVSHNPAHSIKKFAVLKSFKYVPPLKDIVKVLTICTSEQRNYLLFIINTAGRVSEINNLKWTDISAKHLVLRTRKARDSNIVERSIYINNVLQRILEEQPRTGEYIFMNTRTGTRWMYRKKLMHLLCEKVGVNLFTYHSLRHFAASTLAEELTPLTDIQAILGHQNITTTGIYLKTLGNGVKKATIKLEKLTKRFYPLNYPPHKLPTEEVI